MRPKVNLIVNTVAKFAFWLCGLLPLAAQTPYYRLPDRGIVPYGTYELSKIETVNATNGNLSLHIPLTSLPAGRAGFSSALDLYYNSLIWHVAFDPTSGTQWLSPNSSYDPLDAYGWHYGFDYSFVVDSYADSGGTNYRFLALLPDGSVHTLCDGSCAYTGYYFYYQSSPTGIHNMYSEDGSFLRLTWNVTAGTWVLYLPDGGKIAGSLSSYVGTASDLYDRNGNHIQVTRGTNAKGYKTVTLTDDINRQILITRQPHAANPSLFDQDVITQTGFGGSNLTWTVNWGLGGGVGTCPPSIPSCPQTWVPQTIILPTGQSYSFQYANQWGQVSQMTLPSGATVAYTYPSDVGTFFPVLSKVLTWNDENNGTNRTETTTYSFTQTQSVFTHPDGSTTTNSFYTVGLQYPDHWSGLVYKTEKKDQSGSTLELLEKTWQMNVPYGDTTSQETGRLQGNPFAQIEATTRNGLAFAKATYPDRSGNVLQTNEYDWTASSNISHDANGIMNGFTGTIVRTTNNVFLNGPGTAYTTTAGFTANDTNGYWNIYSQQSTQLTTRSSVTGTGVGGRTEFDYDSHGNVVQQRQWDSTKGAQTTPLTSSNAIVTTNTYDAYGNTLTTVNPRNITTQFTYGTVCTGAPGAVTNLYPTQIVVAYGTSDARTFTFQWDCYGGVKTSDTDTNHSITRSFGYDQYSRNTSITEGSVRKTTIAYNDTTRTITTTRDKLAFNDQLLNQITRYDVLGRVRESVDAAGNTVRSNYMVSAGSGFTYEISSNPYVTQTESTMGWTRTKRDSLGRVVGVKKFTGSALPTPWTGTDPANSGVTTTSYNANCFTVQDEAYVSGTNDTSKTNCTDGLGRLTSVAENGLASTTTYTYDALDSLTGVSQPGSVARSFSYSSLKRLTSATNPESGTINYTYDNNGNLATRTDARGIVTTLAYNNLDQVSSKTYSDGTPTVSYTYSAGWLTGASSSASSYTYTQDALGRVNGGTQTTDAVNYPFTATLYPFIGLKDITYPGSNRKYTTGYDAAGRAITLSGQIGANTPANYVTATSYATHGGVSSQTLGNGLIVSTSYNARLQPTQIQAGSLMTLGFSYSATQNNGNILSETITRGAQSWTETFGYDVANRLTTATESGSGSWSQTNSYDGRGNRWVSAYSGLPVATNEVPLTSSWFGSNNRITGWSYDNAGNVLAISGMARSFTYDAESRQKTAVINSQTTTYTYDGDGHRVKKVAPSGTTVFVYDPFGNLAQEYGTATDTGTKYITTDHLGSTRLTTTSAGAVDKCYDYLPFGDEIGNGTGGRTSSCFGGSAYPTSPDKLNQKFTSKERDAETGLDFFLARYYSSAQGRFTSPDEFKGGIVDPFTGQQVSQPGPLPYADIFDPQTLNKYGYVRNNPMRYTDPDGHDWQDAVDLVAGIGRGIAASESFGAVGAPSSSDSTASIVGQGIGTLAVGVVGAITSVGGAAGGIITSPTGVGAFAGAAVATAGAVSATGAAKNLGAVINAAMQSSLSSGSYTNTHESGAVYVGKGDRERSQTSGKRVERETGDKHVATDHTSASNSREGFKDESRRMDQARSEGKKLYNKRESPGKKMRQQDGEN